MYVTDKPHQLDWIQSLRGVAILLVVLCHARYFFADTPQWPLAEILLRPGAMGVDLFFIVSGFIMVYTTASSDGSARYTRIFLIKRFARIWPVYAICTLAWVIVKGNGFDYFQQGANLSVLVKSLLMLPAVPGEPLYFGLAYPLGWTLAFEMYFYVVFAVSMLFKRWRWMALCGWAVLTIVVVPALFGHFTMQVMEAQNYPFGYLALMTNPIVFEFIAGVLIGLLYLNNAVRLSSKLLCAHLMGLTAAFALWYIYAGISDFHGPLKWGWPLALMIGAMAIASKTLVLRPPRWLCWCGAISYSLYLTHLTTQLLLKRVLAGAGIDTHTWATVFITTVAALAVASLCHRFLEVALADWVRRRLLGALVQPVPAAMAVSSGDVVR